MVHLFAAFLACARPAAAAPPAVPAAFEAPLLELRRAVLQDRARAAQEKGADFGRRIETADSLAWNLRTRAVFLRTELSSLRTRAQRAATARRPYPSQDPRLGSDLRFFSWRVADYRRGAAGLEAEAAALSREAPKEEALLAAARGLRSSAAWLRSEAGWLESDARWAAWDFRRAGFSFEAWDLERDCADAAAAANAADASAAALVQRLSAKKAAGRRAARGASSSPGSAGS